MEVQEKVKLVYHKSAAAIIFKDLGTRRRIVNLKVMVMLHAVVSVLKLIRQDGVQVIVSSVLTV